MHARRDDFVRCTLLIPMGLRDRAREILRAIGETLQWWLLGKCLAMIVVGSATAVGLWLLNVPLVLTFGLLSALLTFIPNIGPIISVIPRRWWPCVRATC
jgi:predicted PurR-regulated permease PerM